MGSTLTIEQVNTTLEKYDIAIHSDDALNLIQALVRLPSSDRAAIFDDLGIVDLFLTPKKGQLF